MALTSEPHSLVRRVGVRASYRMPGIGPLVVLIGVIAVPIGLAVMLDGTTYDTWGAFVWGPVFLALAFPLCRWVARRTGEPHLAGFLFGAAALKIIVGALAAYYMVDAVFEVADANRYDRAAGVLAPRFRHGDFSNLGKLSGTRFIEVLDGVVQAVIGQTKVGTFIAFSAFGFLGLCLLYLAFCEAYPTGDRRFYRVLLFLTPTMWFWPSSVGKDAFLLLCTGGAAYGYARLLQGHFSGVVPAGLGLWGTIVVRPHVALIVLVAAVAALPALQRSEREAGRRWVQAVLPLVLLAALPFTLSHAEKFLGINGLNLDTAQSVRKDVVRHTRIGGSEFTPPDTSSPAGFLSGVVTVTLRPFPWEASGFELASALETFTMVLIAVWYIGRRRSKLVRAVRQRWPRFAVGFVISFGWAFSVVGNFGIVARQRSLMLPYLFVLLAARPSGRPEPDEVRPYVDLAGASGGRARRLNLGP